MAKEQLQRYAEVDALLDSAQFSEAIEKMRPWSKIWLNQFYQTYPHRYRILKHPDFNEFWAERRTALSLTVEFVAQKRVADIDFVLGYVFYLLALRAEKNSEANFLDYLQLALKFNSIHAAQTLFHKVLTHEERDKTKKIDAIANLLVNWERLAAQHGAPGFLLLANGYLHLAKMSSELNDDKRYEGACFHLWKNLILAELEEDQSTASIHNAYFGKGLELSNPTQLNTVSLKEKASELIVNSSIMFRAENSARSSFMDDESKAQLQTWRQSKNRAKAPYKDNSKENTLNPGP